MPGKCYVGPMTVQTDSHKDTMRYSDECAKRWGQDVETSNTEFDKALTIPKNLQLTDSKGWVTMALLDKAAMTMGRTLQHSKSIGTKEKDWVAIIVWQSAFVNSLKVFDN
jgi:hypothetical protein